MTRRSLLYALSMYNIAYNALFFAPLRYMVLNDISDVVFAI